jgi:uncharacterized protein (TIGR00369 family)
MSNMTMNDTTTRLYGEPLTYARQILAKQAFSVMLGAEMDAFETGTVQLSLPFSAKLIQQHGFLHGGVIAYLADNALTFAGGSVLGDSVTAEFKINYLRPARDAERLVAIATVVGSGATQAVCRCDVFLQNGPERKLCAAAQGTIRKVG